MHEILTYFCFYCPTKLLPKILVSIWPQLVQHGVFNFPVGPLFKILKYYGVSKISLHVAAILVLYLKSLYVSLNLFYPKLNYTRACYCNWHMPPLGLEPGFLLTQASTLITVLNQGIFHPCICHPLFCKYFVLFC